MVATYPKTGSRQCHVATRKKIRWLDPKITPMRVRSHRSLEAIIRTLKGKHAETIGHEMRLAFSQFLRSGRFGLNTKRLDSVHGVEARKTLIRTLAVCTEVVKGHSANGQAKQRVFSFPGVKKALKKPPTDKGNGSYLLEVDSHWATWRMIPCEWLMARHDKWTAYCRTNNLHQNLDVDGSTDWGKATLESLDKIKVPSVSSSDKPENQARLDKLTDSGVLRLVFRRHGRMYHPLTNLAKVDRRRCTLNGHETTEVDLHASYATLLTSWLPPEDRQGLIAELQSGRFYGPSEAAYAEFARQTAYTMTGQGFSTEAITDRLRGVKVEWQRQCLFSRDGRHRPLLADLEQRHPALAKLITRIRLSQGATGLSHMLTSAEGRLFVDTAIPTVFRQGVSVVGIHDGLIVPVDQAEQVKQTLERIAYRQLGFVPGISIKSSSSVSL